MIKTLVTGHNGMVGSAIVRNIKKFHPNREVLSVPKEQVDLRNQLEVNSLVSSLTPDEIIVSAAKETIILFLDFIYNLYCILRYYL